MGRYDGEDYPDEIPCRPREHSFMMNGICSRCRRSKSSLLSDAKEIIKTLEHRPSGRPYEPRGLPPQPPPKLPRPGRTGPYDASGI